jgi:2-phosphosulfolactate phosphatase
MELGKTVRVGSQGQEFALTFGWAAEDLQILGPQADAVVIVDVLRFTTCVSVACHRGATVFPYEWRDASVNAYAHRHGALVAGNREDVASTWSLSPTDLMRVPSGNRLVLPSPNGSALSFRAQALGATVVAGSLRNAAAVGRWIASRITNGERVAVIAAGERWRLGDVDGEGPLRPAVEDMLGSGAVIDATIDASVGHALVSPEAWSARAAFVDARPVLLKRLVQCASGIELVGRDWLDDVQTSAALSADNVVPILRDSAYVRMDDHRPPVA